MFLSNKRYIEIILHSDPHKFSKKKMSTSKNVKYFSYIPFDFSGFDVNGHGNSLNVEHTSKTLIKDLSDFSANNPHSNIENTNIENVFRSQSERKGEYFNTELDEDINTSLPSLNTTEYFSNIFSSFNSSEDSLLQVSNIHDFERLLPESSYNVFSRNVNFPKTILSDLLDKFQKPSGENNNPVESVSICLPAVTSKYSMENVLKNNVKEEHKLPIISNSLPLVSPISRSSSLCSSPNVTSSSQSSAPVIISYDYSQKNKYGCKVCGKRLKRPSSLSTHMNIHTGNKPFLCPLKNCSKTFNARSNMLRHYKIHFKLTSGVYLLPNGQVTANRPTTKQLLLSTNYINHFSHYRKT